MASRTGGGIMSPNTDSVDPSSKGVFDTLLHVSDSMYPLHGALPTRLIKKIRQFLRIRTAEVVRIANQGSILVKKTPRKIFFRFSGRPFPIKA